MNGIKQLFLEALNARVRGGHSSGMAGDRGR